MMIFRQMVYTGIIAFGLTLVMLTGNIDLSVGNMLTFTCCIAATVMMKDRQCGPDRAGYAGRGPAVRPVQRRSGQLCEAEQLHHHPGHQLHLYSALA